MCLEGNCLSLLTELIATPLCSKESHTAKYALTGSLWGGPIVTGQIENTASGVKLQHESLSFVLYCLQIVKLGKATRVGRGQSPVPGLMLLYVQLCTSRKGLPLFKGLLGTGVLIFTVTFY